MTQHDQKLVGVNPLHLRMAVARFCLVAALWPLHAIGGASSGTSLRITQMLEAGQAARIVCFGDSLTGIYYHSGGRRAWSDLLGIALSRLYPSASIEIINAGVSGNTSLDALKRVDRDVLSKRPDLVVMMFGGNDVARATEDEFRANMIDLVRRIRSSGAELLMMTPNLVYPDDPRRPVSRWLEFSEIIREVARSLNVGLVDCGRTHQAILAMDRRAWTALMSDPIHPNMRGHKLFAEEIAAAISGRRVSLAKLPELRPAFPRLNIALREGKALKIVAMKPFDELIVSALRSIHPAANVTVTAWDTEQKSLETITDEAKEIGWWRQRNNPGAEPPDLIVIAVPTTALAPDEGSFHRAYTWVMNWSLSSGKTSEMPWWDCLVVLPSVAQVHLSQAEQYLEQQALHAVLGQDIPFMQRPAGDETPVLEMLIHRLRQDLEGP